MVGVLSPERSVASRLIHPIYPSYAYIYIYIYPWPVRCLPSIVCFFQSRSLSRLYPPHVLIFRLATTETRTTPYHIRQARPYFLPFIRSHVRSFFWRIRPQKFYLGQRGRCLLIELPYSTPLRLPQSTTLPTTTTTTPNTTRSKTKRTYNTI